MVSHLFSWGPNETGLWRTWADLHRHSTNCLQIFSWLRPVSPVHSLARHNMDFSLGFYVAVIIVIKLFFFSCLFVYRYKRYQKLVEIRRTLATIEEQSRRGQTLGSAQVSSVINEETFFLDSSVGFYRGDWDWEQDVQCNAGGQTSQLRRVVWSPERCSGQRG